MLRNADLAMYDAKSAGRDRAVVFGRDSVPVVDDVQQSALELSLKNERRLKARVDDLLRSNRTDEHTGLPNFKAYKADVAGIDAVARQTGSGYAIALCDFDSFGEFNKLHLQTGGMQPSAVSPTLSKPPADQATSSIAGVETSSQWCSLTPPSGMLAPYVSGCAPLSKSSRSHSRSAHRRMS